MIEYDCPESCNKCKGANVFVTPYYEESQLYETKTICQDCGFYDYWAYGFFDSGGDMVSNCETYSFDPAKHIPDDAKKLNS